MGKTDELSCVNEDSLNKWKKGKSIQDGKKKSTKYPKKENCIGCLTLMKKRNPKGEDREKIILAGFRIYYIEAWNTAIMNCKKILLIQYEKSNRIFNKKSVKNGRFSIVKIFLEVNSFRLQDHLKKMQSIL